MVLGVVGPVSLVIVLGIFILAIVLIRKIVRKLSQK